MSPKVLKSVRIFPTITLGTINKKHSCTRQSRGIQSYCQGMIGVSMKPFSEGDWIPRKYVTLRLCQRYADDRGDCGPLLAVLTPGNCQGEDS